MKSIYKLVGQTTIRSERHRAGLTLSQLAALTSISAPFIGYIERGEKKLSLNSLEKIANGLNVPISNLLKKSTEQTRSCDNAMNQVNSMLCDKSPAQQKKVIDIVKLINRKVYQYEKSIH